MRVTDLTGVADIAPEDAEPEYDGLQRHRTNSRVTLQENNHIVIINGETGEIINDFSAGAVDLKNIDATEGRRAELHRRARTARLREPDAVQVARRRPHRDRQRRRLEGRLARLHHLQQGRHRSLYESGAALDYDRGHARPLSGRPFDAKGVEPEGMEVGTFGDSKYIFVNQERASLVAVYKDATGAEPEYIQSLPSGVGPEGALAIPSRNLYVTANETDLSVDGLAGSHVMIFELAERDARPTRRSRRTWSTACRSAGPRFRAPLPMPKSRARSMS